MIQLHDLFFKKYISKTQINQVINDVVVKINDDYKNKTPVFLIVLNGAFFLVQISLKNLMEIVKLALLKLLHTMEHNQLEMYLL